jgi:zinc-binding alcohol dehydrogenase/oxidoreductase
MSAVILKRLGNTEDLNKNLVIEDLPKPELGGDDVLIKIKYAALNRRDLWITKGLYGGIKLPVVLGSDCSGIIEEKGKNVDKFNTGDEVIVNPSLNWGDSELIKSDNFKILGMPDNGTLEEYISIDKSKVFAKPGHLNLAEASAIPLAGLTAYRAAVVKGEVSKDKKVLITGIGGGVSAFALLFAKHFGADIFVTSGDENKIKKAIELGAKDGVSYKNENWDKELLGKNNKGFDLIIDGTGGDTISKCLNVINPGGRIVNYGATAGNAEKFEVRKIYWKQAMLIGSSMGSDRDFKNMVDFVSTNKITPVVDKIFGINDVCNAFRLMDISGQLGKIIIKIT